MGPIAASTALRGGGEKPRTLTHGWIIGLMASAAVLSVGTARADEGGASFWVPGFFGSLAAAPQVPGWSLSSIYYHISVSAGGDVVFAREVPKQEEPADWGRKR